MVSIIKNQLLKHLSRYTKNLSSDKINISTFRGEGELSNLQLDEDVLNDLLELPSWLRLTSAWCNHVSFRISWTKLKSVPITMVLDEVNVTLETCEPDAQGRRPGSTAANGPNTAPPAAAPPLGKYSFIHKIVDGITIVVNTVNVKFHSPAFMASVQMSRIRVESKTPRWLSGDLRCTRLKDGAHEQLLIFKELSWQTVRIEASSSLDPALTPLRLLTNQARCRITIKKRLSDCSILSSRLVLILDDLLWVLTDSQLKAALHFVDSLAVLIKQSTQLTQKLKAQKKLATMPNASANQTQAGNRAPSAAENISQKSFNMFDVQETSYHFFSQRIDLHLCDDAGEGRSCYPDLKDGGALQISVQGFQIDYYPFHLAASNRAHWPKYKEATLAPALWLEQSLGAFRQSLLSLSDPDRVQSGHAPLERRTDNATAMPAQSPSSPDAQQQQQQRRRRQFDEHFARLMTACVVLRIEDFSLYRVTTSGKKQMPKEFVSSDKDRYSFPAEMSTLHAEFTYFYYPGDSNFPLPPNKMFVHLNPVQVHFHLDSCLWLNAFALNLHESLLRSSAATAGECPPSGPTDDPGLMYMDVKFEAIMPRVLIECAAESPAARQRSQRDRPRAMQIQVSRLLCTNIRELGATRADLAQALHSLQDGSLVFASDFPARPDDLCLVTDRILSHVAATDLASGPSSAASSPATGHTLPGRYALCAEPRDVWCAKLDPLWIDFLGARSHAKSVPFVDAVPITLWLHAGDQNTPATAIDAPSAHDGQPQQRSADLHAIAHIANMVSVQIDHFQYLFLLRLAEELTQLGTFVSLDADRIRRRRSATEPDKSIIFGCVVPQLEVTLVMPSQTPGKEASGLDGDSVVPDSVSLADDAPPVAFQFADGFAGRCNGMSASAIDQRTVRSPAGESPGRHPLSSSMDRPPSLVSSPSPKHSSAASPPGRASSNGSGATGQRTQRVRGSSAASESGFKEFGSSLLTMKKGFSSFMTSIDSALKTGQTVLDDASDSFSIQSDISSDSENFALVLGSDGDRTTDCMDVMFSLNPFANGATAGADQPNAAKASAIEMASEACAEDDDDEVAGHTQMSSPSEPRSDATGIGRMRRDLVSMATFRLTTVEVLHQTIGAQSSVRLQVAALSVDECAAIPWDELQTKFGARCRAWNIASYDPESPPCVQLRMDETRRFPAEIPTITDRKAVLDWFNSGVEVHVKGLNLDLSMSTVIGLIDLAEDEIIGKPLPAEILLENVRLHLVEDRPPVNVTSPGTQPIDLFVGELRIRRDSSGIVQLQPVDIARNAAVATAECEANAAAAHSEPIPGFGGRDREILALQLVMQQLKLDNEQLKWQLRLNEKSTENAMHTTAQESEVLRNCLNKAQQDIGTLLGEKQALLNSVRSLQKQLLAAQSGCAAGATSPDADLGRR